MLVGQPPFDGKVDFLKKNVGPGCAVFNLNARPHVKNRMKWEKLWKFVSHLGEDEEELFAAITDHTVNIGFLSFLLNLHI